MTLGFMRQGGDLGLYMSHFGQKGENKRE